MKCGVTATEFLRYQAAIEREQNEATTTQWYIALLASILQCMPYRIWGQDVPEGMDKPSNYLLKFGTREEMARKEEEMSEEEARRYAALQKSLWLQMFGFDEAGNKVEDVGPRRPQPQPPPPPAQPPAPVPQGRRRPQVITHHGH